MAWHGWCTGHNNKFTKLTHIAYSLSCAHVQKPTRESICWLYAHVHEHALVSTSDENGMKVFIYELNTQQRQHQQQQQQQQKEKSTTEQK